MFREWIALVNFDLKSIAGARAALPVMSQKLAMMTKHRGELGGRHIPPGSGEQRV